MVSGRNNSTGSLDRRLGRGRAAAAVLAAAALLGCAGPSPDDPYHYAVEQIRTRYVEAVGEERLQSYSLKGILTRLDPHSDYLDEPEYRALLSQTRGEYSGIGALIAGD